MSVVAALGFGNRLSVTGVVLQLNTRSDAEALKGFDTVLLATGVTPCNPRIPGQELPHVLSYIDVLTGARPVGQKVVVIGAGGIGFDVPPLRRGE